MMRCNNEFAPAFIVRISGWPLNVVDEFAAPGLAKQALIAIKSNNKKIWESFENTYQQVLLSQRARLWEVTAKNQKFLVALATANPPLADRVLSVPWDGPRNKRRRKLETTLYRFLSRATARTEPCGLWSGTVLANWGKDTVCTSRKSHYHVTPDLRPFISIIRRLSLNDRYRRVGKWKINPSLQKSGNRNWEYWLRVPAAEAVKCKIESNAGIDRLLSLLKLKGSCTYNEIFDVLQEITNEKSPVLNEVIERCINSGILIGGFDLNWQFSSPREALRDVERRLIGSHQSAWRKTRIELEKTCVQFKKSIEGQDFARILNYQSNTAELIKSLATDLNVPIPDLPNAPIQCDLSSPFNIQIGEKLQNQLQESLKGYLKFQGAYGFGEGIRRSLVSRYLEKKTNGSSFANAPASLGKSIFNEDIVTWQLICSIIGNNRWFDNRIKMWEEMLLNNVNAVVASKVEDTPASPFGCFLAGLSTIGQKQELRTVIHGVFDDLCGGVYSRYAPLWNEDTRTPQDSLYKWFSTQISKISKTCGIDIAELVTPYEINPNVLSRPHFGVPTVSPWCITDKSIDLSGTRVVTDVDTGAPLLSSPLYKQPISVFSFVSANILEGDPIAEILLATSLRLNSIANLRADAVPFKVEINSEYPSPRIIIPGGEIVRNSRTVFDIEKIRYLLHGSSAERYAKWSLIASQKKWPSLVRIQRGRTPPILVPRDSPLALESIFEGARSSKWMAVDEFIDEAWVTDELGNRYVAEFAIPFFRSNHIWSKRAK